MPSSPAGNVYKAQPATAATAFSLLKEFARQTESDQEQEPARGWDLSQDFEEGFNGHQSSVFRYGAVTGLSRLRTPNNDSCDEEFGQLSRRLLMTHLRQYVVSEPRGCHCASSSSTLPAVPSTFIIYPISESAFAPETFLEELLRTDGLPHERALTQTEAIRCLDSVQLLPVCDFAAAAQAIGKVADSLRTIHSGEPKAKLKSSEPDASALCQQHAEQTRAFAGPLATTVRSCGDCHHHHQQQPVVLLIVVGLDSLANGVVRSSNATRGAAQLSSALRTLTQLSRTYPTMSASLFLSVMLVNTSGLGTGSSNGSGFVAGDGATRSTALLQAEREQKLSSSSTAPKPRPGTSTVEANLHSIFSSGESLLPSLLMKVLDQGIDTHLLLSTVRGRSVVEVIKDRLGDGLGRWCSFN